MNAMAKRGKRDFHQESEPAVVPESQNRFSSPLETVISKVFFYGNIFYLLPVITAVLAVTPRYSSAQSPTSFILQRYRPAFDPYGGFQSYSGKSYGQWSLLLATSFHFNYDPLFLVEEGRKGQLDVVKSQLAWDISAGIGLLDWLDLEIRLPLTLYQSGKIPFLDILGDAKGRDITRTFALRDLSFFVRTQILREESQAVNMGAQIELGVPTGDKDSFNGEDGITFALALFLSKRFGLFQFNLNLGYRYQPPTKFLTATIGHELSYALGGNIYLASDKLAIIAELIGSIGLAQPSLSSSPLSGRAGARLFFGSEKSLFLDLGVGVGIIGGIGSPKFRALLNFGWLPRFGKKKKGRTSVAEADRDGDGLEDSRDRCPNLPGPPQNMGCPADRDGDGVPDSADRCPDSPGPADNSGCPKAKDTDFDGVPDSADQCPEKPGPADNSGCPKPKDTDSDGVPDSADQCPEKPGPADNSGCPKPKDTDSDGVPDSSDRCPEKPGPADNSGCPKVVENPDRDGDRIPNRRDRCPDLPGSRRRRGCPRRVYVRLSLRRGRIYLRRPFRFRRRWRLTLTAKRILIQIVQISRSRPQLRIKIAVNSYGRYRKYRIWNRRQVRSIIRYLKRLRADLDRIEVVGKYRKTRRRRMKTIVRVYVKSQ